MASVPDDFNGWRPEYQEFVPQIVPEMFVGTPLEDVYRELAVDMEGFPALVDRMIALEHEPMAWEENVAALETPVLITQGDADIVLLDHSVEMFRLLGGGMMGVPLPESRLAILPGTSHTAVINQPALIQDIDRPLPQGRNTERHVRLGMLSTALANKPNALSHAAGRVQIPARRSEGSLRTTFRLVFAVILPPKERIR